MFVILCPFASLVDNYDIMGGDKQKMHVLIIGAGIVGLTLAQGCRENGIPFTIFEQDQKGSRHQGWALTLHWCLRSLERTIGSELAARLPTVRYSDCLFPHCVKANIPVQRPSSILLSSTTLEISSSSIVKLQSRDIRSHPRSVASVFTAKNCEIC